MIDCMNDFDTPYWNLAQAAAWALYREKELVAHFSHPEEGAFGAIGMYPAMWPQGRQHYGKLSDLLDALLKGSLKAEGYHSDNPDSLEVIPKSHWTDLSLHPPLAFDRRYPGSRYQPWKNIRVASADLKKLWRSKDEIKSRTKYDWDAIHVLYEEAQRSNPRFSQNKLIEEAQLAFQDKFGFEPPSRTAFQRRIKDW